MSEYCTVLCELDCFTKDNFWYNIIQNLVDMFMHT